MNLFEEEENGGISPGRRWAPALQVDFKHKQMDRVLRGEVTLSGLAREIDVRCSVIRKWKRPFEQGANTAAVAAGSGIVPARLLREAEARIRELERALGRKTMEVEILQAA